MFRKAMSHPLETKAKNQSFSLLSQLPVEVKTG